MGAWCSGITSASHAEGPGFKSQCAHFVRRLSQISARQDRGNAVPIIICATASIVVSRTLCDADGVCLRGPDSGFPLPRLIFGVGVGAGSSDDGLQC